MFSKLEIIVIFLNQLGLEIFKNKVLKHLMFPFFSVEKKFGPLEKRMKND
jgi:hypothetical protein